MPADPRISLVHFTGNTNSRNVAQALAEAGWLREIITSFVYEPDGVLARCLRWLPKGDVVHEELSRRVWTLPRGSRKRTYPVKEILRISAGRLGLERYFSRLHRNRLIERMVLNLDRKVARHHLAGLTAVYSYEDTAATTFEAAKRMGVQCLYELPLMHFQRVFSVLSEERQRFPELSPALQSTFEPGWKIDRKRRELELADHIFVASSVSRESLLAVDVPSNKISVVPYGAPVDYFFPTERREATFRALFVGLVGPRKGVHYLLQAWRELNLPDAELVLVGHNEFPAGWLEARVQGVRYVPSVPHHLLSRYYGQADVLVFPSLAEGFGLVLLEAMACGLPVLTTTNTAGPDIVTEGDDGFVIPPRDVEKLKAGIEFFYRNRPVTKEMGRQARKKAETLTWARYREEMTREIGDCLWER